MNWMQLILKIAALLAFSSMIYNYYIKGEQPTNFDITVIITLYIMGY